MLCHSQTTLPVATSSSCATPSITVPLADPPNDERSYGMWL